MNKKIIILLLLFSGLFSKVTLGKNINRAIAIGIPPEVNDMKTNISFKYFFENNYGLQSILSYKNSKGEDESSKNTSNSYLLQFKVLKKLQKKKFINTYLGVGWLYGKNKSKYILKTDSSETTYNAITQGINITLGVEYFLKEAKNLGFSAEVGYYFIKQKSSSNSGSPFLQRDNIFLTSLFGLHYYFK